MFDVNISDSMSPANIYFKQPYQLPTGQETTSTRQEHIIRQQQF